MVFVWLRRVRHENFHKRFTRQTSCKCNITACSKMTQRIVTMIPIRFRWNHMHRTPTQSLDWSDPPEPYMVQPFESFFDLVFVGVVAQISDHFEMAMNGNALPAITVASVILFVLMWLDFTTCKAIAPNKHRCTLTLM